jgi:hypothetical protein
MVHHQCDQLLHMSVVVVPHLQAIGEIVLLILTHNRDERTNREHSQEPRETAMPAPKGNQYAKGNKEGEGARSNSRLSTSRLPLACVREVSPTNAEIAEVLAVSEPTIHAWKLRHEKFALALKRTKEGATAIVEASLFKRANGFERDVEKPTASGRKVRIKEYFPPDVAAQRLWLQNRMPDFSNNQ